MNKLTIIGRACRDAEQRTTSTGKTVASFTVAVDRRGKDAGADFFRVTCWDKLSDIAARYITKGKQIAVIGSVSVSEYDSKGEKRFSLDVTAQDIELLGSKDDTPSASPAASPATKQGFTEVDDDDLPF